MALWQLLHLAQSHCGDNWEGTLFSWLHIYCTHLASVRFEHSVCPGSLDQKIASIKYWINTKVNFWQSYIFIFRRLKNNNTCFFISNTYKQHKAEILSKITFSNFTFHKHTPSQCALGYQSSPPPPQKKKKNKTNTTPSFLPTPKRANCLSPPFLGNPSILIYHDASPKIRFFTETQKH